MTIENFIAKIEEEFDDIKEGSLKPESKFGIHFEMNSINSLIMIALISTEYGVIINADDLRLSVTIKDLFEIINRKID